MGSVPVMRLTDFKFLFYMYCDVVTLCLELGDPSVHSAGDSCECVSWGALGRTAVSLVGAPQCPSVRRERESEGSLGCLNLADMGALCN